MIKIIFIDLDIFLKQDMYLMDKKLIKSVNRFLGLGIEVIFCTSQAKSVVQEIRNHFEVSKYIIFHDIDIYDVEKELYLFPNEIDNCKKILKYEVIQKFCNYKNVLLQETLCINYKDESIFSLNSQKKCIIFKKIDTISELIVYLHDKFTNILRNLSGGEYLMYDWLLINYNEKYTLFFPELELKNILLDKFLVKEEIGQIVEVNLGFDSREIVYSQRNFHCVLLDLGSIIKIKKKIIKKIPKEISNVIYVSGNILKNELSNVNIYLKKQQKMAIIHNRLFSNFTYEEQKIIAFNVFQCLKEYKGIWMFYDTIPLETKEEYFSVFQKIGFKDIEIHKLSEVIDEYTSVEAFEVNMDWLKEETENHAIFVLKI